MTRFPDQVPACFLSHRVWKSPLSSSIERYTSPRASFLAGSRHIKCIRKTANIIEDTFDPVANIVQDLIAAVVGEEPEFLEDGVSRKRSFREMPYLDHIHLYKV